MPKGKFDLILLGLLLLLVFFLLFRCNGYYRKLSGKEGRITIAHVYGTDTGSHDILYYKYIYEVNDTFYSTTTAGSNVKDLKVDALECFLVVFYRPDPTIHTVLWSYRFDAIVPLGSRLDTLKFDRRLIRKYTIGWHGLNPKSHVNDMKAVAEYENRIGRKL